MPATDALAALQERLGYRFGDQALLVEALTHESSISSQAGLSGRGRKPTAGTVRSNERLEFLGDRVLGLLVTELLLTSFPDDAEGPLTNRLAALVEARMLAVIGAEMGLGQALIVGHGRGERLAVDPNHPGLLGDACEAIVAAVHLDGGIEASRALVRRFWSHHLATHAAPPRHPKQLLQELAAARHLPPPLYEVVGQEGPSHAPSFAVRLSLGEEHPPVTARGPSKRAAEQECAIAMLNAMAESKP